MVAKSPGVNKSMEQNCKKLRLCQWGRRSHQHTELDAARDVWTQMFPIVSDSPFHWLVLALEALWASQVALVGKNPPAKAGEVRDTDSVLG